MSRQAPMYTKKVNFPKPRTGTDSYESDSLKTRFRGHYVIYHPVEPNRKNSPKREPGLDDDLIYLLGG